MSRLRWRLVFCLSVLRETASSQVCERASDFRVSWTEITCRSAGSVNIIFSARTGFSDAVLGGSGARSHWHNIAAPKIIALAMYSTEQKLSRVLHEVHNRDRNCNWSERFRAY